MKKIYLALIAAAVLTAIQATAIPVTVTQPSPGYGGGHGGGEFNIKPNFTGVTYGADVAIFGGFETFCVQANIDIVVPGTYNATLGQADLSGNALTKGTAYLYQLFALENPLLGYNYVAGAGRTTSANDLQQALWILQGQGGPNVVAQTAGTSADIALAVARFGSLANAMTANTNLLSVSIVQLTDARGVPVQNMLTLIPSVPDGGSALIMMGMGLSSLALFARKFRA